MPVVNIDWLETASTLQKELPAKVMPLRRRTMINALLALANTHTRLACLLSVGNPEGDCNEDYETVEEYFCDAVEDFQGGLRRVLGWQGDDVEAAAQLDNRSDSPSFERTPSPFFSASSSSEGDVFGRGEAELQLSERSHSPGEDFYSRLKTSLLSDLQEPLVQQLQDPLLDALSGLLSDRVQERAHQSLPVVVATSREILDALTLSLSDHAPLITLLLDNLTGPLANRHHALRDAPLGPCAAAPAHTAHTPGSVQAATGSVLPSPDVSPEVRRAIKRKAACDTVVHSSKKLCAVDEEF
ncbi:hypothetical protein OH76DRAFT_1485157 [Lentinus brumalis]|uniref:Uncharacterized protein n=1 Tax=Lentinus brumalis TaxID=2498619 RepID=A0A371D2W0_9APHY|nr:hypothetical protein OH76DRAFT_1485157 [Polyporus brumalis]